MFEEMEMSGSVHCAAFVKNRNHSELGRRTDSDKVSSPGEPSTSESLSVVPGTPFRDRRDSSDVYGCLVRTAPAKRGQRCQCDVVLHSFPAFFEKMRHHGWENFLRSSLSGRLLSEITARQGTLNSTHI